MILLFSGGLVSDGEDFTVDNCVFEKTQRINYLGVIITSNNDIVEY